MTDQEISIAAAELAQAKTREALRNAGIDEGFVARRLSEAMSATEVKVFNGRDGLEYSDHLIDNKTRLEATKFAATLLDMKPAEKHDVNVKGDLQINIIDRFGGE